MLPFPKNKKRKRQGLNMEQKIWICEQKNDPAKYSKHILYTYIQCITKCFELPKCRKSRKKSIDDKKLVILTEKSGNSRISLQTLDKYDLSKFL